MPALEISQSMLVNQGLSASAESRGAIAEITGGSEPALADIVGSFKQLVANNTISTVDQGLVGVIAGILTPIELATYFIAGKYAELGGR